MASDIGKLRSQAHGRIGYGEADMKRGEADMERGEADMEKRIWREEKRIWRSGEGRREKREETNDK